MAFEEPQKALLTFRDARGRIWVAAAAISRLYPEGAGGQGAGRTLKEGEPTSLVDFKVVEY